MRLGLDLRPRADRDLVEIAEYIAADNLSAAIRFLESARRSLEFLMLNPHAGAEYPVPNRRLGGLRKWAIDGFRKYLIFYRVTTDAIQVLRVVHGARDLPTRLSENLE